MTAPTTPLLVTVQQAAAYLALSRTEIYTLMYAGQLSYVKVGRARRIPYEALVEWVRAHTQTAA